MLRPTIVASGFFAILATTSIVVAQSGKPFFAGPEYAAGGSPKAIVSADFDGDGYLDVAVANESTDDVSVLHGNGRGYLSQAVNYAVLGDQPRTLAMADFNGDGRLDLVTSNYSSNDVSVLLAQPTGGFALDGVYGVGGKPIGLVVGDFDANPGLDIAVASFQSKDIWVLFNDGVGGFDVSFAWQLSGPPRCFAVGDVNSDGHADLITTHHALGRIVLLLGDGLGGFTITNSSPISGPTYTMLAKDVSGDGKVDLVVGMELGFIVLAGNGAGSFSTLTTVSTGATELSGAFGDVDLDGIEDLVFAEWDRGTAQVFRALGNGTFASAGSALAAGGAAGVAIGEFNGDGAIDLAVADNAHGVSLLLTGGPAHGVAPSISLGAGYPNGLVLRDVDLDGDLDAVTSHTIPPLIAVALNDGHGAFKQSTRVPTSSQARSLALGRLNGDAYPDAVVVVPFQDRASIHFGVPGGGFGALAASIPLGDFPSACALGDLNNDGTQDLVATNPDAGALSAALGDGTGKFGAAVTSVGTTGNLLLALERMDGDATLDAIAAGAPNGASGTLAILHGNGLGGFTVVGTKLLASRALSLATGDFDADGHVDAVVTLLTPSSLQVVFGDGTGNWRANSVVIVEPLLVERHVTVADVNRDGALDLVLANTSNNSITIYFGDGHGQFAAPLSFTGALQPAWLAIGDVNGDGAVDIVTADGTSGVLATFLHGSDETAVSYCTAGTTTHGCSASMTGVGAPSASALTASGFELRVTGVEGQKQGTLFYGGVSGRVAWPWAAGSTSFLCVAAPTQRFLVANSGGTTNACNGSFSVDFNHFLATTPVGLGLPMSVGQTVQAQAWFRDPPAPKQTNLSDAVEFQLLP